MNKTNIALVVALVAVVIAIGAYQYPKQASEVASDIFGAFGTRFPNGVGVGTTSPTTVGALVVGGGTNIMRINVGACDLSTGCTNGQLGCSMNASTTKMHFCSATGVQAGDMVFVTMPSGVNNTSSSSPLSGPGMFGSISAVGAHATTSGIIGVLLENTTGVATSSYEQATTSVDYMYLR